MAVPISLKRRLERKFPRVTKSARHWARVLTAGQPPETRLVFVVGAQRSGTRLPLQVIEQAPDVTTFSEGADPFFDDVLLRPLDEIERLVRQSPSPIVALKPICETHRVHELLDRFPASRAVWIFRNYQDTVNSTSVKWTSGRDSLRRIARLEFSANDWRVGGFTEEKFQLVARLYRDDMSLHEANAVMWYLRNSLFFDLRAHERSDILLVQYEDLTAHPQEHFGRLFAFIGTAVPEHAVEAIRRSARSERSFPEMAPEITALCEELHNRLVEHYQAASKRPIVPPSA
jgi:hypothetical protein